jgi:hypothetical protein
MIIAKVLKDRLGNIELLIFGNEAFEDMKEELKKIGLELILGLLKRRSSLQLLIGMGSLAGRLREGLLPFIEEIRNQMRKVWKFGSFE